VEEFDSSNLLAVAADGHVVVPDAPMALPSITAQTLVMLAQAAGMRVARRPLLLSELASMAEVGAVGTHRQTDRQTD
jgi:branched-subunit amino acid aminotransferase/4-amino-4-deoxychorismate lyase